MEIVLGLQNLVRDEHSFVFGQGCIALDKNSGGMRGLAVQSVKTALGGKVAVVFGLAKDSALKAGDRVRLKAEKKGTVEGVVRSAGRGVLVVVADGDAWDALEADAPLWDVSVVDSQVPFVRMRTALDSLLRSLLPTDPPAPLPLLTNVLLGTASPAFSPHNDSLVFLNKALNASQQLAIKHCLAATSVALIHGPPGTGKTETVIELVRQLVAAKQRVLLCGPSNIAVDTLASRLTPHLNPALQMTRVGHPTRVRKENVLNHVLDVRVRSSDEGQIANDVRAEMDSTLAKIQKTKRKGERRGLYDDLKKSRVELRVREKKVIADILKTSNVVVATLCGCGSYVLENQQFDAIVIDESSQAIEAESWIAILKSALNARVFLAGDNQQLPPTVKSFKSSAATTKAPTATPSTPVSTLSATSTTNPIPTSLTFTLFDRLLAVHGPTIKTMLTIQYRMNDIIKHFPSKHMYNSLLTSHPSVSSHLLADLPNVSETQFTTSAFTLLNTSLAGHEESTPDGGSGESLQNRGEADLVVQHVASLLESGVLVSQIAVITPYSAQVVLLKSLFAQQPVFAGLEVGTVDSFQGAEAEAVVLSLVRSNVRGEVGFLGDERRLNVAVTRARRHLCVVMDEGMKIRSGFLKGLVEWAEAEGDVIYVD
ncbi:hypothetical protein HDU98_007996 [Podochytrium sp. JEL0797]|nr:hypothetical protein HDU98_007996 [Podochytrium sp. JEL0797]